MAFVSRDDLKTGLHVTHRSDAPAEVHRFAEQAFDAFFAVVGDLLGRGVSLVAEAAFHADRSRPSVDAWARVADVVHVAVVTPDDVVVRRYRSRSDAGTRHPAHADDRFAGELERGERDLAVYRLALDHPTIEVDGSDGWRPGVDEVAAFVFAHRSAG